MAGWDWTPYAMGGATRPDSFTGMNPAFSGALADMFAGAPAGIRDELRVYSGYRSPAVQQALWDASDKTGHMVARPGGSQHNKGNAADLRYLAPAAQQWVHQNAGNYGLTFPMGWEPWHIELQGARGGPDKDPFGVMAAKASGALPSGGASPSAINQAATPQAAPQAAVNALAPQAMAIAAGGAPPASAGQPLAPGGDMLTNLASLFVQGQALRQKQQAQEQADADARRLALLTGGLGGLYGA